MIVHTDTCFTLHTAHTSYQMAVGPGGALLHTYYGPRLPDRAPDLTDGRRPHDDPGCWTDLLPKEWSAPGAADHRTPPCIPAFADGSETAEPAFVQAEAAAGKPALPGLPAFRDGDGVETLTLTLRDVFGLEVQLRYTVYEAEDLITRTAVYTNTSSLPLTLHKAASLCLDFAPGPMDLITLNGAWAAERTPERAARQADIDLFVLDDGWFKGRNGTASSLGDWTADRAKLPDGLPGLCAKLNAMDLGLGLWVEPEAVSPDSDLYRAHPDWAFAVPGRQPCQIRCQYNLDLSRPEVVDGVWQQLEQVLRSCPIQYLKWDMNRALADVYSPALPAARQGEVYHRYVLGLYELQRRVTETFPDLLLENCAGGGAYLWHLAADVEPDYTVTVVSRLSPEEALLDAVEEKLTALAADEPNAGLVVLADCGEADNIHPVDKEPAGRRLALLALETVYGQPVAGRSPQLLEARRGPGPGQVLLRFAHHAGGMQVRGGGVQLAGPDGVFRDAQAAPAAPDRILACCGALRDPCAVRYAWYNYGPAGLYGGTGLPAAPFGPRTLND